MKRKKTTGYEDYWDDTSIIIGTGQYQRIGELGKTKMAQIGFVRQKVKPVSKPKKNDRP